eukprot:Sspe_Gene.106202::Locus_83452_Transcript_1_1_Confidence_1.000_Length_948::g.106202::m.106202
MPAEKMRCPSALPSTHEVETSPCDLNQLKALSQSEVVTLVVPDGTRFEVETSNVRQSQVLAAMLDSGLGIELTPDGAISLDMKASLLCRIVEFLRFGRVTCKDVRDYYEVCAAAQFLILDGITEDTVEPLSLKLELKARKLVLDECDDFISSFFAPYLEKKRLARGYLEFTVDITAKITSNKKFVNVFERQVAWNLLKNTECRKLWVSHMQEKTGMRIQVRDTKDEHGEFVNFRTQIKPADLALSTSPIDVCHTSSASLSSPEETSPPRRGLKRPRKS